MSSGWTQWDYAIATAYQTIEDHTDSNGLLIWERQTDRVDVVAEKKVDRFRAQVEKMTNQKKYKPTPGEYWIPKLELIEGDWPTHAEFVREELGLDDEDDDTE